MLLGGVSVYLPLFLLFIYCIIFTHNLVVSPTIQSHALAMVVVVSLKLHYMPTVSKRCSYRQDTTSFQVTEMHVR